MNHHQRTIATLPTDVQVVLDRRHRVVDPLVTLIVPAFDVEEYVQQALESILKASTDLPVELIVIDDGSKDATLARVTTFLQAVESRSVLVLSQPNKGLSAVRNMGARLASGEWIAFLDSDDSVTVEGFRAFAEATRNPGIDLILGQTEIVVGTGEFLEKKPFYHAEIWMRLLEGADSLTTSIGVAPELLALEPNANYRWIRKSFYQAADLHFAEGRYFEDIPVHFRMLCKAQHLTLVGVPYYLYRINRPGKITEERSLRRFDAIVTLSLGIDELRSANLNPRQAGAALRVLDRLAWGCGTMTLPHQRLRYFRELVPIYREIPWTWRADFFRGSRRDPVHLLMGLLLATRCPWLLAGVNFLTPLRSLFRQPSRQRRPERGGSRKLVSQPGN